MRLGLISPKGYVFGYKRKHASVLGEYLKLGDLSPAAFISKNLSTALPTIAALTPTDADICIVDENCEPVDFDEPFDLVGITVLTPLALRAYQIADAFRARGVPVVIGGVHATLLPEEARAHADTVFVGEAEETWPRFIADFLSGRPQPFYKADGQVDLRTSPIPRYDLLQDKAYKAICVQATRGCPHDCEFCSASKIYGRGYRRKTLEQVVEEIRLIKSLWPSPVINFTDDNLFVHQGFARELVKALIPLNVRWTALTDVSVADDEELLDLMAEANCVSLFIGFETVTEKGLAHIDRHNWKLKQLEKYPTSIERIHSRGIGIFGAFIVGLDTDDLSTFKAIEDFIVENNIYRFQIVILIPFPGTRLRERLEREGRLLGNDWGDYSGFDATYIPKNMTPQELEDNLFQLYHNLFVPEVERKRRAYFRQIQRNLYRRRLKGQRA